MRWTGLLIFILLSGINIYAQKRNPPPAPPREIITVETNRPKILESDGFSIEFPSMPSRTIQQIETAFGKTNMVSYRLATGLGFYAVNFFDFPSVLTNEAELKVRLDAMKTALLKDPNDRLVSETEIFFGDHRGVEYVIEGKNTTLTMRGLFVKQRFFQLMIVTNGRMSRSTERVKNFNRKNIEKFINSFAVTKIPVPKTEAAELPSDFGVEIDKGIFTSRFFGFSIKLPENWRKVESEQTEILMDLSRQNAEESSAKFKNLLNFSLDNTKILLFMTKEELATTTNNSVFVVAAERVSFPNFLPKAMTDSYLKTYLEADEKASKPSNLIKLGGAEFAWIEVDNTVANYKQRIYIANRKGIAFQILFIFQNETDLKQLLDSLQTVKFNDEILMK